MASAMQPGAAAAWRPARFGGCVQATVEQRSDGTRLWRSTEPLGEVPRTLTDRLEHWAAFAPERVFAAGHAALAGVIGSPLAETLVRHDNAAAVSAALAWAVCTS